MRIKPFRAWRPPADLVSRVASLPYDVVDTHEARRLAAGYAHPDVKAFVETTFGGAVISGA